MFRSVNQCRCLCYVFELWVFIDYTWVYSLDIFSQCPRKDDEVYAGELLLGMKYSSGDPPISQTDLESLSSVSLASEGGEGVGHLQVHIVEGAGIVDEETHKPFNTICKW